MSVQPQLYSVVKVSKTRPKYVNKKAVYFRRVTKYVERTRAAYIEVCAVLEFTERPKTQGMGIILKNLSCFKGEQQVGGEKILFQIK